MKSKIVSISKDKDFIDLIKGRRLTNKYFTFFFKKLSNKSNSNLNISFVTKKKLVNAVKRNKIKRRLKNMTNEAIKEININFNNSYLIIAKDSILKNEYKDIKKNLFVTFKKAK